MDVSEKHTTSMFRAVGQASKKEAAVSFRPNPVTNFME
jgi:hypothetical protein